MIWYLRQKKDDMVNLSKFLPKQGHYQSPKPQIQTGADATLSPMFCRSFENRLEHLHRRAPNRRR
jgi:hypothetical protein